MGKADSALVVALGQAEGTAAVPTFSRAGTNASCCPPILLLPTAPSPTSQSYGENQDFAIIVCHCQPTRQSWLSATALLSLLLAGAHSGP